MFLGDNDTFLIFITSDFDLVLKANDKFRKVTTVTKALRKSIYENRSKKRRYIQPKNIFILKQNSNCRDLLSS